MGDKEGGSPHRTPPWCHHVRGPRPPNAIGNHPSVPLLPIPNAFRYPGSPAAIRSTIPDTANLVPAGRPLFSTAQFPLSPGLPSFACALLSLDHTCAIYIRAFLTARFRVRFAIALLSLQSCFLFSLSVCVNSTPLPAPVDNPTLLRTLRASRISSIQLSSSFPRCRHLFAVPAV